MCLMYVLAIVVPCFMWFLNHICIFLGHPQKLVSGLSLENPLLPTILSSLKEVAKIDAEVFEGDVDSVIKDFAVKKVLRRDETVSETMHDVLY